jgi:hypothetical protein
MSEELVPLLILVLEQSPVECESIPIGISLYIVVLVAAL